MKLQTVKNLFEYKDTSDIYETIVSSVGQFQALGLPDICIIWRRQIKSYGIMKSHTDLGNSFHFVQGLCPQSQADVSAYIHNIINCQEKEQKNQKLFNEDVIFWKISYLMYDMFSRTIIVCQFEQPDDSISQFKCFGVTSNKQMTPINPRHWDGAYITSVLKTIDYDLKITNIGKFLNQVNLTRPQKIKEFLKRMLQYETQSQNLSKIKSKNDFPNINDAIYYLHYPIWIIARYLERQGMLDVLYDVMDDVQQNISSLIIKSVLCYKMKKYHYCLQLLSNFGRQSINFLHYLFAQTLIKLEKYNEAYIILQDLVHCGYGSSLVWIALSSLFRKQQIYNLSLIFLNRYHYQGQSVKQMNQETHLANYKLIAQKQDLQNLIKLDQIYQIQHPQHADKLESYIQLCGHPNLDSLLVRIRGIKKDNKLTKESQLKQFFDQTVKTFFRQEYKISCSVFELITSNTLLEVDWESNLLYHEATKLFQYLGPVRLKTFLQSSFYQPKQQQKAIDCHFDSNDFAIILEVTNNLKIDVNKTFDQIADFDSDDERPDFTKQKVNQSFDAAMSPPKKFYTPQNKKSILQQRSVSLKKKKNNQKPQQHTTIQEEQESMQSERYNVQFGDIHPKAPKSGQTINQPKKVEIHNLQLFFEQQTPQNIQIQINDQQLKRKEKINPIMQDVFEQIVKINTELDNLFHTSQQTRIQQQSNSQQVASPQFKSTLVQSVKNKKHLYRQIDIKDYYVPPNLEDDQDKELVFQQQLKGESMFLYKCAKLAILLRRKDMGQQILKRMSQKIISVQVSQQLLLILKESNLIVNYVQKMLQDFLECGVNQVSTIPIWLEQHIVRLVKLHGSNNLLSLLTVAENDFTFYLLKMLIVNAGDIK
ncbi:hypothetical protein pb186bvf_001002 [Paramecium bursaria]